MSFHLFPQVSIIQAIKVSLTPKSSPKSSPKCSPESSPKLSRPKLSVADLEVPNIYVRTEDVDSKPAGDVIENQTSRESKTLQVIP